MRINATRLVLAIDSYRCCLRVQPRAYIGLVLLAGLVLAQGCSQQRHEVKIEFIGPRAGSGEDETPYEKFDTLVFDELGRHRARLNVKLSRKASKGSIDTVFQIDALTETPVEKRHYGAIATTNTRREHRSYGLGLAQSDVLYHFANGGHPQIGQARSFSNVRSLARVFEEWLLIGLARPLAKEPGLSSEGELAVDAHGGGRSGNSGNQKKAETPWAKVLRASLANSGLVGTGTMATALNVAAVTNARWKGNLHNPLDRGDVECKMLGENAGAPTGAISEAPPPDTDAGVPAESRVPPTPQSPTRDPSAAAAGNRVSTGDETREWRTSEQEAPAPACAEVRLLVEAPDRLKPSGYISVGMPETVAATLIGAYPTSYRAVPPCHFREKLLGDADCEEDKHESEETTQSKDTTVAVDAVLVASREMPADVVGTVLCILDWWDRQVCGMHIPDKLHCGSRHGIHIEDPVGGEQRHTLEEVAYCGSRISGKDLKGFAEEQLDRNQVRKHTQESHVREAHRFDELPLRLHRAASIRRLDPVSQKILQLNGRVMLALFFVTSALYLVRTRRRTSDATMASFRDDVRKGLAQILPIAVLLMFGTIVLTGATWVAEFHSQNIQVNAEFVGSGFSGALLWVFQFIFTDSNDIHLRSVWATIFFGAMKLLWTLASLAPAVPLVQALWERRTQHARMRDHVIVIGCNDRTETLTWEMRKERPVALVPSRDGVQLHSANGRKDYHIVHPVQEELTWEHLRAARLDCAEAVVIVADQEKAKARGLSADMHTLQLVQQFRRLEQDHMRELPQGPRRLVVEVEDARNRNLPLQIGAVDPKEHWEAVPKQHADEKVEVICARHRGSYLLSQAITKPDVVRLFDELLENNEGNELYQVTVGQLREALPINVENYAAIRAWFAEHAEAYLATPVGVHFYHNDARPVPSTDELWRPGRVVTNPPPYQAKRQLMNEDRVLFLALSDKHILGRTTP